MLQLNLKMIEKTASKFLLFNQKVTLCCISQKLANPQKEISYFLTKMITQNEKKLFHVQKLFFPITECPLSSITAESKTEK